MSFTLGSGKRLGVSDLTSLANQKPNAISIEESVFDRLDGLCQGFSGADAQAYEISQEVKIENVKSSQFTVEMRRAALIYRVHTLLSGKTPVRAATIKALTDLINYQITPYFSTFEKSGLELVEFLSGKGFASTVEKDVVTAAEAFSLVGITAHSLANFEVRAFQRHPFLLVGLSALVIGGANHLVKAADSIAALSVEAKGVIIDAFDPTAFETNRQHRGQITSATTLKLLLEGSKRASSVKDINNTYTAFNNIPQINGPSLDVIAQATKSIEIELNSTENMPLNPSLGSCFDPTQALILLNNVGNALLQLYSASQNRIKLLVGGDVHIVYVEDDFMRPFSFLKNLGDSMARELLAAQSILAGIESQELIKKKEKEERVTKEFKQKPEADDSNYTPEQLAKIEAKRKAKAEAAAAKAAAKEQKKSGLALGAGTSVIRKILVDALTDKAEVELSDDYHSLLALLPKILPLVDPMNLSESSIPALFNQVVEQLTIGGKRKPKIAKGARDFTPEQMRIREQVFTTIRRVFKRHGGVEIDTPVFELKEVLTGKYGEDSKLIYDLADQGGELLALRYDLTVPFARFLAMNSVGNIKRYHIAKVYRRDQPQLARGRYREFYQCDFDIAGKYNTMIPDAEVITVATEILSGLPIGNFMIKLSHRKLLDSIFDICGVPVEKFRPICSAVDKLDKMSWEEVKVEMVEEKGLAPEVADKISKFVLNVGKPLELWAKLKEIQLFGEHVIANQAMDELKLLFDYLQAMGSLDYISFDLSLARGLDYYTGVIYEAVILDGTSQVGSIAAGGRYDNLVGMFSTSGAQTPCVGVSIGVERVFTIMEKKAEKLNLFQSSHLQVYVASIGPNLMLERMKVSQLLWKNNISAEFSHQDNPKFKKQLDESLERGIPYMVIIGQDELEKGVIKVKDMKAHSELEVPQDSLISTLESMGCLPLNTGNDTTFIDIMKQANITVASENA